MLFECIKCHDTYDLEETVQLKVRNRLHNLSDFTEIETIQWIQEIHQTRKDMWQAKKNLSFVGDSHLTCWLCEELQPGCKVIPCPLSWSQLTLQALAQLQSEDLQNLIAREPLLYEYEQQVCPELPKLPESKKNQTPAGFKIKPSQSTPKEVKTSRNPQPNNRSLQKRKVPPRIERPAQSKTIKKKPKVSEEASTVEEVVPFCECECPQKTRLLFVKKKNENYGKGFYGCPGYPNGCGFFQWSTLKKPEKKPAPRQKKNKNSTFYDPSKAPCDSLAEAFGIRN